MDFEFLMQIDLLFSHFLKLEIVKSSFKLKLEQGEMFAKRNYFATCYLIFQHRQRRHRKQTQIPMPHAHMHIPKKKKKTREKLVVALPVGCTISRVTWRRTKNF